MMKFVFGLLVLANLGLLMWGSWYHEPLVTAETPKPREEIAADKLRLLSEPGVRLVVRAKSAPPPRPVETSPETEALCYRLGPFPALEKARVAGARLEAWKLAHERVAELETLGPAYRLILPPLPSKEAAEDKRRELTRLGFTDHALVQREEGMENAIALGIFTVEQNAQARQQQLARKGIEATMQPVPNVQPIYWLALAAIAEDGKLGEIPLARFGEEDWGVAGVALQPTACAAIGRTAVPTKEPPPGQ
jgi:hypothetical protein